MNSCVATQTLNPPSPAETSAASDLVQAHSKCNEGEHTPHLVETDRIAGVEADEEILEEERYPTVLYPPTGVLYRCPVGIR